MTHTSLPIVREMMLERSISPVHLLGETVEPDTSTLLQCETDYEGSSSSLYFERVGERCVERIYVVCFFSSFPSKFCITRAPSPGNRLRQPSALLPNPPTIQSQDIKWPMKTESISSIITIHRQLLRSYSSHCSVSRRSGT